MPYDGATVGSDLDSRQGVAIDIVTLYQTPSIPEYVHATLVTVEYSVSTGRKFQFVRVKQDSNMINSLSEGSQESSPYRGVTVGRDPHASKVVGINFVLYKLAPPLLMDVNAPRLSVMDLTAHNCGVGVGLDLEARYTVSVDVTVLKVTLEQRRGHPIGEPAVPLIAFGCLCPKMPRGLKSGTRHGLCVLTMPWSKVNTPTSRPWWMWLRLMMGLPWFLTQIPASALLLISLSS